MPVVGTGSGGGKTRYAGTFRGVTTTPYSFAGGRGLAAGFPQLNEPYAIAWWELDRDVDTTKDHTLVLVDGSVGASTAGESVVPMKAEWVVTTVNAPSAAFDHSTTWNLTGMGETSGTIVLSESSTPVVISNGLLDSTSVVFCKLTKVSGVTNELTMPYLVNFAIWEEA